FLPYSEFVAQIDAVARAHPDVRFLIKAHPLSNQPFESSLSNVTLCDRTDNIHALIELSQAVVCYNSGVGFLALVHGKPLFTLGNAFYNLPGCGRRAPDFAAAVKEAEWATDGPNEQ